MKGYLPVLLTLTAVFAKPAQARVPSPAALDQYGGRLHISCRNPTGHFIVEKVKNRWWFCTPAGHVLFANSVGNVSPTFTNGSSRFDSSHQSAGGATAAKWIPSAGNPRLGYFSFTFPAPLPANALAMDGLNTSGFSPSGYNLTDALIMSANPATGVITVGPVWGWSNPGVTTTLGTGTVDLNISQTSPVASADCARTSLGRATAATCSSGIATFTFSTPLPASAIPGNFLYTSGFSPSGWTLDDSRNNEQEIYAVNSSTGAITVHLICPAGVTTLGSGAIDGNTYRSLASKYGDTNANWGWNTLKRMRAWGFNAVGQDSVGWVLPTFDGNNTNWPGGKQPIRLPYFIEFRPAGYGMVNQFGYLAEPVKDLLYTLNDNYAGWRGAKEPDVFDPKFATEWTKELQADNSSGGDLSSNSPWLAGLYVEDTDWVWGSGAGPDFVSGHTTSNSGFITLIAPPLQTLTQSDAQFGRGPYLYSQTQFYTKAAANNPSTTCSTANPCSLRDFLWQKYGGSISALNAAWGSHYTTFDSSGTTVTREHICAWGCAATTYSHTFAHAPVDPWSVTISVRGAPQIGDLPWFKFRGTANTGQLLSPRSNYVTSSTINYSTGALSLAFSAAPSAAITVSYTYGGWMAGGTGLMDESGSGSWVGTNSKCLENNPNNSPYFACTGAGGGYEPLPNANARLGADIDAWVAQYYAQFEQVIRNGLNTANPTPIVIPYFGLDITGAWETPPSVQVLQGEAPYVDGIFASFDWSGPTANGVYYTGSTVNPETAAAFQYLTRYIGDKPVMSFIVGWPSRDSDQSCPPTKSASVSAAFPAQAIRGLEWYQGVNYFMSTPGYYRDFPVIGFDFWSWQDFAAYNQGLVSQWDNAYDGHEAVGSLVSCSPPVANFTCGGDNGNYGDSIDTIKAANLLWLKLQLINTR